MKEEGGGKGYLFENSARCTVNMSWKEVCNPAKVKKIGFGS
jgi:hypothetical protein